VQYKIDWFAFTFPITLLGDKDNEYTLSHILMAFHDHTKHGFLGIVTNSLWQWQQSAGFYTHRIQCPKTLITLSWSAGNPYAQFEAGGQAMDKLREKLSTFDVIRCAGTRTTRLDFAVDIETAISPKEFSVWRDSSRIVSEGLFTSVTGETVYVGSRKSDRMARVYRYAAPHPRSHLLRVEAEYKGDAAKQAADELCKFDLKTVCLSAHLPFGWHHPVWQPGNADFSKIPARAYDREGAGTLRWLRTAVVPAIRKAHHSGLIDFHEFIQENFGDLLDELENQEGDEAGKVVCDQGNQGGDQ
jgi:DNA relaxase NicK